MAIATPLSPSDALFDPLRAVAARRRARSVLRVALGTALAALGAATALEILALSGVAPARLPLIVAAGAAALVCGSGWAYFRRRTRIREAFFVDRASGLEEAYGTAVELASGTDEMRGPVGAALMATATARAAEIAPRSLIRIFTPGFFGALAMLAALGAAYWGLQALAPSLTAPTTDAPVAEEADAADAAAVESVARLLAEDAEARDDPMLAAIAQALAERGAAAGEGPLPEELAEEIDDLLAQAAGAYGDAVPQWLGEAEGARLANLDEALAAFEAAQDARAPAEFAAPEGHGGPIAEGEQGPGLYQADPDLSEQYEGRGADELISNLEAQDGAQGLDAGAGEAPEGGPRLMQPQDLQAIGAVPVGAALQSGRGESDAAGLGQETLQADDAFTALDAAPGEDLVVSAEPQVEGSRIRMEIVPQAAGDTAETAVGALEGAEGTPAAPVARDFVPFEARDITSRYFERQPQ